MIISIKTSSNNHPSPPEHFTCENFQVDIWDKTFSIQMDSDWSAADWSESDPIWKSDELKQWYRDSEKEGESNALAAKMAFDS